MAQESPLSRVTRLGESNLGIFRGRAAVDAGMSRKQIAALVADGVLQRVHPDTYRIVAVAKSSEQDLRGALDLGRRPSRGGESVGR